MVGFKTYTLQHKHRNKNHQKKNQNNNTWFAWCVLGTCATCFCFGNCCWSHKRIDSNNLFAFIVNFLFGFDAVVWVWCSFFRFCPRKVIHALPTTNIDKYFFFWFLPHCVQVPTSAIFCAQSIEKSIPTYKKKQFVHLLQTGIQFPMAWI